MSAGWTSAIAVVFVLTSHADASADDPRTTSLGSFDRAHAELSARELLVQCVGIVACGRAAVRSLPLMQDAAAAPEPKWQQRHARAVAKKQKGEALFWTGSIMLATGLVLGILPANSKYCSPNYNYPTSECAKHMTPPLVADVLGTVLLARGRKVRAAAIRDLAVLDRERRGVH